jgi:hypothetical protein
MGLISAAHMRDTPGYGGMIVVFARAGKTRGVAGNR